MISYFDEKSLNDYLTRRFPDRAPFTIRNLAGGVSCLVFLCESSRGDRWVMKQARDKLAVAEEWKAPQERIFIETLAMQKLAPFLPDGCVPKILFTDRDIFTYGMEAAPVEAVPMKSALIAGPWRESWFHDCGTILAAIHRETAKRPTEFVSSFDPALNFEPLRVDAYYRWAARSHPELNRPFDAVIASARSDARCLVHGDFSPKNILVTPVTDHLILLDYEVAHWGNPAFDLGFFLTHPLAKGIFKPNEAPRFAAAIRAFAVAYFSECGPLGAKESDALLHWGAVALARVDGKSPLEYLTDPRHKAQLRGFGTSMLQHRWKSIADVADALASGDFSS